MHRNPRDRPAPLRWALIVLGLVCMSVAAVGVIVPGLPTTIFLILASYFFVRSCPALDTWMRESRLFRPYTGFLDRREPMPVHAVALTLCFLWLGIGFSIYRLWGAFETTLLLTVAVSLGAMASLSVIWWGRVSILRRERVSED